ncbi:MAG: phosphoribosylformylglycinamidine cyclo-ligase [Myxococcales bacterium]|nr:phosphoribosylformylglycinamidine cyclo-ligase [Myxococcales bacterium]
MSASTDDKAATGGAHPAPAAARPPASEPPPNAAPAPDPEPLPQGDASAPHPAGPGASAHAPALTYAAAGVDIAAGNEAVRRIKAMVAGTRRPEQIGDIGGFAGLIGLPSGVPEPVLVACTDGVGTKLLVAIAMDRHDTVGIDLVAMNVNDLLVAGAQPLFLLDYIATGRLAPDHVEAIIRGIVEGCRQSGCSLLGGETAELPGLYGDGHYDLAAFAVGVVSRDRVLGPGRVRAGDLALGLRSTGLHSNGYSLARKALLDPAHAGLDLRDALPGDPAGQSVGEILLTPTRIYEYAFAPLRRLAEAPLHGAAHITGGGLIDNPQRALGEALAVELDLSQVPCPPVLAAIAAQRVPPRELLRTFNCGVGMILYVDPDHAALVQSTLRRVGEEPIPLGRVVPRESGAPQVRVRGGAWLAHTVATSD